MLKSVLLLRGHENHLAAMQTMRLASDADFRVTFVHMHEPIERGRVLAQALSFVKGEDCHSARRLLHDFAADNGAVLVAHQGHRDLGAESGGVLTEAVPSFCSPIRWF
jgi:hypothetical protein